MFIVDVCVVVCVVLVLCAAVKTGVEDVSNMLLCAGFLVARMLLLTVVF